MQRLDLWLTLAVQDFEIAHLLQQHLFCNQAAYHAQQAAEKALKGYIARNRISNMKTHDLKALVLLCASVDEKFLSLEYPAEFLMPYATLGRYPDTYIKLESYEATELIKHAKKIVRQVLPNLE